jgi:hypothetical protein
VNNSEMAKLSENLIWLGNLMKALKGKAWKRSLVEKLLGVYLDGKLNSKRARKTL